jgi:hypothetical protein
MKNLIFVVNLFSLRVKCTRGPLSCMDVSLRSINFETHFWVHKLVETFTAGPYLHYLDLKCVFVGYSCTQKGYRCWRPSEGRFLSMDVTFRERESYYRTTNNIGITLSPPEVQQEGGD